MQVPLLHLSSQFLSPHPIQSRQSNTLNLNWNPLRQLINSNTTPRRFVRKKLLIDAIHLREIIHGGQENVYFDHLADIGASGFKDGGQVSDAEFGHLGDCG